MIIIWISFILLNPLSSSLTLDGIDISKYQGVINWNEVAKNYYFAIIKVGSSKGIDINWENNYWNAKKEGIKVGAYWYSYAKSVNDSKSEANSIINSLSGKKLEWPIYYDIEDDDIFNLGIQNEIAENFCSILISKNYYCGIYSNAYRLTNYFNNDIKYSHSIWVANYNVLTPSYTGPYHIWQKSNTGEVAGISGNCDIDEGYIDFEPIMELLGFNGFKGYTSKTLFVVTKINQRNIACFSTIGSYDFYIEGQFFGKTNILKKFYLQLETSSGSKITSMCTPFQFLGHRFQCSIEICRYPLNNDDIILPVETPQDSNYDFFNWKEIIGTSPGISNVISNVNCLPEESNVFVPSSIDVGKCSGNKNVFTINGSWSDKSEINLPILSEYLNFELVLDNENKNIAECKFGNNFNEIKCEFKGHGDIRIKEQFFMGYLQVFKILEIDSLKNVEECKSENNESNSSYIIYRIVTFFLLLLFYI